MFRRLIKVLQVWKSNSWQNFIFGWTITLILWLISVYLYYLSPHIYTLILIGYLYFYLRTWFLYIVHHWRVDIGGDVDHVGCLVDCVGDIGSEVLFCVSVQKHSRRICNRGCKCLTKVLCSRYWVHSQLRFEVLYCESWVMSVIQWLSGKGYLGIEIWHCLIATEKLRIKKKKHCNVCTGSDGIWWLLSVCVLRLLSVGHEPYWRFPLSGQKQTQPRT